MKLILALVVIAVFSSSLEETNGKKTHKSIRFRSFQDKRVYLKDVPYLAFITSENGKQCAGTLISKSYVLTAAHCVLNMSNSTVIVSLGKNQFWAPFAFDIPSKNIITFNERGFEAFDRYNLYHNFDIALIELSEAVEYSKAIQPAVLPSWIDINKDLREDTGERIAWDINKEELTINVMSRSHMITSTTNVCKKKYDPFNTLATKDVYGTSYSEQCDGTTGGPLIIDDKVYGITMNFKRTCNRGNFLFTKVTSFLPWIAENTDIYIGLQTNVNE